MAWLKKNVWLLCIAAGWVLAFAAWFAGPAETAGVLMACSLWLMGFGIGWIVRDERSER